MALNVACTEKYSISSAIFVTYFPVQISTSLKQDTFTWQAQWRWYLFLF